MLGRLCQAYDTVAIPIHGVEQCVKAEVRYSL